MTQEEKQLLFADLCARLPYEVQCHIKHIHHLSGWIDEGDVILTGFRQNEFTKETEPLFRNPGGNPKIVFPFDSVKPYLRSMSSMTEKEKNEYDAIVFKHEFDYILYYDDFEYLTEWLNSHHFDYCGLIEKGLALEAPEGMYKTEKGKDMKTIDAIKEIARQVSIYEFMDENDQKLINRMRGYINAGHDELGLDAAVIGWAEDATDEQIISAINEYLNDVDKEKWL